MPTSSVTIITVSYNSMAVLPAMLKSVPKGTPVVVVDNASSDTDPLKALTDEYGATLQLNEGNVGFGPACNQGAAKAETEFLLFLNPDAELQDGALDALLEAAKTYPDASGFNPRILD
ncbi:glycosyltransferase, partial [Tateyamaria sp.]